MSSDAINQEIIFFVLTFILFYLSISMYDNVKDIDSLKKYKLLLPFVFSLIFIFFLIGFYYFLEFDRSCTVDTESYQMLELSRGAICKGGPYMAQGDSERAKMCRELQESPEGKCEINSYNCAKGYRGQPGGMFQFNPESDARWENTRCDGLDVEETPCRRPEGVAIF